MLSRLLHRNTTPAAEPTPEQKIAKLSASISSMVKDKKPPAYDDVTAFASILRSVEMGTNGDALKNKLLERLAYNNGNTSYIEPFVEAAYKQNHPERTYIGRSYKEFAKSRIENQPVGMDASFLVYKLLDDRFHSISDFPVNSFALLGKAGVVVPDNRQEQLLYRAVASSTPIETIQSALTELKLDPNQVKDSQQRTMLHTVMSENNYRRYNGSNEFEHILDRTKKLGIVPSADMFGRYPEEFGDAHTRLMYAQYFESKTQESLSALATYLQSTLHNFGGLGSVGSRNQDVYLKSPSPLAPAPKSTMFKHIFNSNDINVIAECQRLIAPTTRQHMDIEGSFPYVFIENYVCSPNAKPEVANQVFALLQDQSPKDLSTALGYFLMRSENYYKNYDVEAAKLTEYPVAVQRIMDYQAMEGLTDLMALETTKLNALDNQAQVAGASMGM